MASISATKRTAAGGDDDAGQQEARLRPAAVAVRQPENQEHCTERAGKSQSVDAERRQAEQDGKQRAATGAAGNAQHVRISQRIAQQHLHQRPGQREQPAAGKSGQRARQTQFEHDIDAGYFTPEQGR